MPSDVFYPSRRCCGSCDSIAKLMPEERNELEPTSPIKWGIKGPALRIFYWCEECGEKEYLPKAEYYLWPGVDGVWSKNGGGVDSE